MENPKRRKTCKMNDNNHIVSVLNIESLPNEIFMNIFSNLNIKDLFRCAQVSKKFRQISHDKSFWKFVNLFNQNVSCELIGYILSLGTEYLNLQETRLYIDSTADIPPKNNLKYLNLAQCSVDDKFLVRLLRSSSTLEKFSLKEVNQENLYGNNDRDYKDRNFDHDDQMLEVRRSWYIECLLPNLKMLTSLDLSNNTVDGRINSEAIKAIVLTCVELKEANFRSQIINFGSQIISEKDCEFFVNNLTSKIEKLNISENGFLYKHILTLVKRCKNITELDLHNCELTNYFGEPEDNHNCLIAISENLSQSLVKLQLPDHSCLYREFLKSLPKLRYLWKANWNWKNPNAIERLSMLSTDIMKEYPHIFFNEGTAKIAHCANEYFEPKQGFWEVNCNAVDLSIRRHLPPHY